MKNLKEAKNCAIIGRASISTSFFKNLCYVVKLLKFEKKKFVREKKVIVSLIFDRIADTHQTRRDVGALVQVLNV
jgi:hypothetical protein